MLDLIIWLIAGGIILLVIVNFLRRGKVRR